MCAIVSTASIRMVRVAASPRAPPERPKACPEPLVSSLADGAGNACFPGISWGRPAAIREQGRAGMREDPRLLRSALGLRAANVRARARRAWERARGLHPRLLPAGAGPVRRDHGHEAVARHAEEPEAQEAAAPLPGHQDQALLQARHRAPRPAIPPRARELAADPSVGDLYLSEEQILERVSELGAQ